MYMLYNRHPTCIIDKMKGWIHEEKNVVEMVKEQILKVNISKA